MKHFPELRTERLVLNRITYRDIPRLIDLANNAKVIAGTRMPDPYTEEDAVAFLHRAYQGFAEKSAFLFAIRTAGDRAFIGGTGLHLVEPALKAEIGYWIGEPYWNQGYVTESTAALLKFGFETIGLNKIYASHTTTTPASGRVLEKNGMIREGVSLADHRRGQAFLDVVNYRMLKSEYEQLTANP